MYLIEKVKSALYEAEEIAFHENSLSELSEVINDLKMRLDKPIKVAVVGVIKAGKSTLINALLRKEILATGNLETTYAVTWFKYGETPKIQVTFKNDTCSEFDIKELQYWTVRDENKSNPKLDDVRYVTIFDDNPLLKSIEIIDTPGLGSTHKIDSENTIDFLGLSSQITTKEASKADAIIYAFSKGVGENDSDVLSAFQNSFANSSPINAFGVLTRVDAYWKNIDDENPFESAGRIALRYKTDPYLRTKIYNIIPVSSITSGCSTQLSDLEYRVLYKLSLLPKERLSRLLSNAERFCIREYEDIDVPAKERQIVFNKLDRYGIYQALQLINADTPRDKIMERLYACSHVGDIADIIHRHFVKRAGIIKAYFIISKMKDVCQTMINHSKEDNTADVESAQYILSRFQEIEENEQCFSELKVLQYYYNREFQFPITEEEAEFLRLTGEQGETLEDRLGCQNCSVEDMIRLVNKKANYWYSRSIINASQGVYSDVARTLGRICEHIHYYLKKAQL